MEKLPENFGKKDIPDIDKGIERATNKIDQEIKSQREAGIPDEEISASAEGKINIPKLSKEPKEEKREKEKEYEYEWEKQIDSWMEGKIKREMERLKTEDRGVAEQNVREKIRRVLPRVFRSFAVHGMAHKGGEEYTDLDGKTCLGLMKLVGWDIKARGKDKNVSFVDFDERLEGVVHLDVGQYNGVTFLEKIDGGLKELRLSDKEALEQRKRDKNFFFNLGVIVDHHPEGAPSSAGVLSKLLYRLGLFKETEPKDMVNIKKMVRFVDLIDSQGFQEIGKPENWNQSDRTILGLHRFLNFSNLWRFFKEEGDFYKPLTDAQLRKYGLIYEKGDGKTVNYQESQRKIINDSDEKLKEFEKNQFIIDTNFGKMVIDAKGELVGGATAAQSIGAGYLKWDAEHKTFFMFSNQELDENLFDNGIRVRKRLWLMPKDKKDTGLNLGKIINKIKGKIIPDSGLEKYLRSEKKEGPKEEKREKEKKKEQPSKVENKKEKAVEDYVQEDIDKAKKIFDNTSLDFQKQVEVLKGIEQHLSKLLNLSPEKINLRKLTKMTPEELNEWLNAVKIITKPEVQEQLNKPETKTLLRQGVEVLQKSDKEKSQEKPPAWLAKAKETAKLGGWALGAGVGIFAIIAFLLLSLGLDKLLNIGGGGKKK